MPILKVTVLSDVILNVEDLTKKFRPTFLVARSTNGGVETTATINQEAIDEDRIYRHRAACRKNQI